MHEATKSEFEYVSVPIALNCLSLLISVGLALLYRRAVDRFAIAPVGLLLVGSLIQTCICRDIRKFVGVPGCTALEDLRIDLLQERFSLGEGEWTPW